MNNDDRYFDLYLYLPCTDYTAEVERLHMYT